MKAGGKDSGSETLSRDTAWEHLGEAWRGEHFLKSQTRKTEHRQSCRASYGETTFCRRTDPLMLWHTWLSMSPQGHVLRSHGGHRVEI